MSVFIISGDENLFLDLLRKAEATAVILGVDIINKSTIIEHEFLMNLVSAAKTFIYILLDSIFNVTLFNFNSEV
jgi:hypothetical protein